MESFLIGGMGGLLLLGLVLLGLWWLMRDSDL
jgi:hypothetical protein